MTCSARAGSRSAWRSPPSPSLLHVAALALAPLSVVQVALSTGVVMLAVMGERLFGCKVGSRQWVGVIMTATGLTLLVLTLPRTGGDHSAFAVPALIAFQAGMLALGVLLIAAPRLGTPAHHHGAILGAAAGTLFGVSDVALKALTSVGGPLELLTSPWLPVALLASVLAFLASARGFQEGEAVPVIACTSTAANITVITGGIVVFGDALAGGVLLGVQIARLRARRRRRAGHAARASRRRVGGRQAAPMRRLLVVLFLLLACATPAQAAPRALGAGAGRLRPRRRQRPASLNAHASAP